MRIGGCSMQPVFHATQCAQVPHNTMEHAPAVCMCVTATRVVPSMTYLFSEASHLRHCVRVAKEMD